MSSTMENPLSLTPKRYINNLTTTPNMMPLSKRKEFNAYVIDGRKAEKQGNQAAALDFYAKAAVLYNDPKLVRKIHKIQKLNTSTPIPLPDCNLEDSSGASMQNHGCADVGQRLLPAGQDTSMPAQKPGATISLKDLSAKDRERFNYFVSLAKEAMKEGNLELSLEHYLKSQTIIVTEKVQERIEKVRSSLKALTSLDNDFVHDPLYECWRLDRKFFLSEKLYNTLYPHQREGVKWLWKLFNDPRGRQGGILGDDMGLGKTIQVSAFLDGIIGYELANTALLVMPLSLLSNWEEELQRWAPELKVYTFHSSSKKQRQSIMEAIQRENGILLTTYGMVSSAIQALNGKHDFTWDFIFLDEGHKIKNHTRDVAKKCRLIKARSRFILSGTPIQNSLEELWALFDFVCKGKLLGGLAEFKSEFAIPIVAGTLKNASEADRLDSLHCAELLRERIKPHFLRREKSTTIKNASVKSLALSSNTNDETKDHKNLQDDIDSEIMSNSEEVVQMPTLKKKTEIVCWIPLSDPQVHLYKTFLQSEKVQVLLNSTRSPLAALTVLKKICDHPRLLSGSVAYREALGLEDRDSEMSITIDDTASNDGISCSSPINNWTRNHQMTPARSLCRRITTSVSQPGIGKSEQGQSPDNIISKDRMLLAKLAEPNPTSEELQQESNKLQFTVSLMERLNQEGHRVLLFSQSKRVLDQIQLISGDQMRFLRIDGDVKDPKERQRLIDLFNSDPIYIGFLLTTQVGGVGLTLTGADRVIIFDPSWNPSVDAQAVDRAYRIGQEKSVVVYRLVTCGTVEEKIYRKQVFKNGLSRTITSNSSALGYFTKQELKALFSLDHDGQISETQQQLIQEHDKEDCFDADLDAHIQFLETLPIYGLSYHSLLFSDTANLPDQSTSNVTSPQKNCGQPGTVVSATKQIDTVEYYNHGESVLHVDDPSKKIVDSQDNCIPLVEPSLHCWDEKSMWSRQADVIESSCTIDHSDSFSSLCSPLKYICSPIVTVFESDQIGGRNVSHCSGMNNELPQSLLKQVDKSTNRNECCLKHKLTVVHVELCSCSLDEDAVEFYNKLIDKAFCESGSDGLDAALAALTLCSDDIRLHRRALQLARSIGLPN